MTNIAIRPAVRQVSGIHTAWHTCPTWCVHCWSDPDTRYHCGEGRAVGATRVGIERFDDETGPGEVRVFLAQAVDGTYTPTQARRLAALLLAAAGESEQR